MDYRLLYCERVVRKGHTRKAWMWGTVAAAAFMLGFIAQGSRPAALASWQMERLRAVVRDALYREADTLPVATDEAITKYATGKEVSVTASYTDHISQTSTIPRTPGPSGLRSTTLSPSEPTSYDVAEPSEFHQLAGFRHVYQTPNNCGPATLAVALSYYGWRGEQSDIASVLKPQLRDKNVRWDEMVFFVRNYAGWLDALFRVGGDFDLLELFIANGYPVIIETGYEVDTGWVGHYLLATGYNRPSRRLTVEDVTGGPGREISYSEVEGLWRQFNHLYILVFPADDRDKIEFLLDQDASPYTNRQHALVQTRIDTETDPQDAFTWFAYGSNLAYFDRYREAALAYDRARKIGLPWRMLFYQFGPYIAYFNVGRYKDVVNLATASLQARPDLEESYVWRGWARHMLGQNEAAVADFKAALRVNSNFLDATRALQTVGSR